MDISIDRSCQACLFICWWEKWRFLLLASSFNFASKLVMASQRQWWRFSFVIQMQSLFFMKLIFENAESHK